MKTVLILYAYCENQNTNYGNKISKDNLIYFLNHGIINNNKYK